MKHEMLQREEEQLAQVKGNRVLYIVVETGFTQEWVQKGERYLSID